MNKKMASLFDGIGGFPLSAVLCGIDPIWASEIEPFPILTTHKRFPNMKHVGSVTDINGAEVEPVGIITFGSPCQDLSVAGKQAGIHDGERSNLFFEAVRIIKEMRANDRAQGTPAELCRPRFAVWENVPGAFSSNKGRDFQAVLQALAEVADPDVSVPLPEKSKWQKAGCIVGNGWSIAWRVYDAQFWGVPQRRKRIYLIADFGSERAGEILFEPEGVRGDSAQGRTPWQGFASDPQGRTHADDREGNCLNPWDCQSKRCYGINGVFPTLYSGERSGQQQQAVCVPVGGRELDAVTLEPGIAQREVGHVYEGVSGTLRANAGDNQMAVAYTLKIRSGCEDGGKGALIQEDKSATPATNAVAPIPIHDQATRFAGKHGDKQDGKGNGLGVGEPGAPMNTLTSADRHAVAHLASGKETVGTLMANAGTKLWLGNKEAFSGDYHIVEEKPSPVRYIVRRLTPLECCRLQGYPDGWTENLAITDPTEEEIDFFVKVWADWAVINGTKPKSRSQVIKWLADPQSDSAEYKAYGNSLAIPCAYDVIRRVSQALLNP